MPSPALAETLRHLDDTELLALLRARPDLATPPPGNTEVLARRATTMASVARACEDLDTFVLTVFETLLVAGAHVEPVSTDDVARLLGPDVPASRLAEAVATLRARALVWDGVDPHDTDGPLSVAPAARDAAFRYPGGLGAASDRLDGVDLAPVLAELEPEQRHVLDTLAAGPPVGTSRDAGDPASAIGGLVARGLLMRTGERAVELPRQVALAIRGERPMGPVQVDPPAVATVAVDQAEVDSAAAAEALTLSRNVESLLDAWSAEPPLALRSGGIGVRELRRVATLLRGDAAHAALLVEVMASAGLVALDDDTDSSEWVPTTHADGWLAGSAEQRWAELAAAWLAMPRLPMLAATRDAKGRPLAALSTELRRPLAPAERRRVLDTVAGHTAIADTTALLALLAWRAPRRGGRLRDDAARAAIAEATTLGIVSVITGTGIALSSAGRSLLVDVETASARMADALPEPVDHVLLQADMTAVAPGPLTRELAGQLALVADAESTGSATVYRISEGSVRRALDSGKTADDLHTLFHHHSATPVPQGLDYLVDDVARKHGRLRGGAAGSFLRSDHDVLISEVLANPVAGRLALRRIAPTVLVSPLPLSDVLDGLRKAGFAPAGESADGAVVDVASRPRRVPGRRQATRDVPRPIVGEQQLAAAVRTLRAGEHASAAHTGKAVSPAAGAGASTTVAMTLAVLRSAARSGDPVLVSLVDSHGTARQLVLTPAAAGGGVLEGSDADGEQHRLPLHLITSVAVVEA